MWLYCCISKTREIPNPAVNIYKDSSWHQKHKTIENTKLQTSLQFMWYNQYCCLDLEWTNREHSIRSKLKFEWSGRVWLWEWRLDFEFGLSKHPFWPSPSLVPACQPSVLGPMAGKRKSAKDWRLFGVKMWEQGDKEQICDLVKFFCKRV